jgi:hypothetical protein
VNVRVRSECVSECGRKEGGNNQEQEGRTSSE